MSLGHRNRKVEESNKHGNAHNLLSSSFLERASSRRSEKSRLIEKIAKVAKTFGTVVVASGWCPSFALAKLY